MRFVCILGWSFIRKVLKKNLARRCENALSTDWLVDDKAKTFPLRGLLHQSFGGRKKVKKAMRDSSYFLKRLDDVFTIDYDDGAVNVAIKR